MAVTEKNDSETQKAQTPGTAETAIKFISSGMFVGYIPLASGTFGSLWVLVLFYLMPAHMLQQTIVFLAPGLFILGVWSSSQCTKFWGNDPSKVIIDEVAGMLVTLLFLPLNAKIVWVGFFIFRVFDIVKPPPIGTLERLPGGWGIMTDDVLAGVYANISLRILMYYTPYLG